MSAVKVTYLMIDEVDPRQLGRYRVRCVDGERQTFDDDASLVAALDRIEARRA